MFQAHPDNGTLETAQETPTTPQKILGLIPFILSVNFDNLALIGANLENMKEFLESNDFAQYFEMFESEEITLDVLAEMSHPELKELGIKAYGHRHRLLRAARRHLSGPPQSMIQGF